jgi:hypothetical protein
MNEQNAPKSDPQSCPPLEVRGREPATLLNLDGRIVATGKAEMTTANGGAFFPNQSEIAGNPPSGALLLEMHGSRIPILLDKVCDLAVYTIHQHFLVRK